MRGFTLVELLVTVTITAVLLAIAVPSYSYVIATNRMANELSALLGDIKYARSEALKEGVDVIICASTDLATCDSTTTAWHTGWIVHSTANATVLRVHQPFTSSETFVADNGIFQIVFSREGFPRGLPTSGITFTLHSASSASNLTRCLAVNLVGQLTPMLYTPGTCI